MEPKEQDDLRQREVDALEVIAERVRELNIRPREEHPGARSWMARFPALRISLALCVHVRGVGDVEGLASRFKPVPAEYVDKAERRVRCVCGTFVDFGDLRVCPGGCGRFFASDGQGAFAARFEPEEVAAAAQELEDRAA